MYIINRDGYGPELVFNADEIGRFRKLILSRIFISKNQKTALEFKATKDRLMLVFRTNARGYIVKSMLV